MPDRNTPESLLIAEQERQARPRATPIPSRHPPGAVRVWHAGSNAAVTAPYKPYTPPQRSRVTNTSFQRKPTVPTSFAAISARSMKCALVLDAAEIANIIVPDGSSRFALTVQLPDRAVVADVATKSVRRAVAVIGEHGPDAFAVVLQGRLQRGDTLSEAGLSAMPKTPKPAAAEAA
jgi:hypothetical protein